MKLFSKNRKGCAKWNFDTAPSFKFDNYPNLTNVGLSFNKLEDVNVSMLQQLKQLFVNNNSIKQLDLSNNSRLEEVRCSNNEITGTLNLEKIENLLSINCNENHINHLLLGNKKDLHTVNCQNNVIESIQTLNCPKLRRLQCQNNKINSLDFKNNTELDYVDCSDNNIDPCEMNELFESLTDRNSEFLKGKIVVANKDTEEKENPNVSTCKTTIARSKGWEPFRVENGIAEDFNGDGSGCENLRLEIELTAPSTLNKSVSAYKAPHVVALTIKGEINARDIAYIRDTITNLQELYLNNATIKDYDGQDGTDIAISKYKSNELPSQAFLNMSKLSKVSLPGSLTEVCDYSFMKCKSLTEVWIGSQTYEPKSLKAFPDQENLSIFVKNENIKQSLENLYGFKKTKVILGDFTSTTWIDTEEFKFKLSNSGISIVCSNPSKTNSIEIFNYVGNKVFEGSFTDEFFTILNNGFYVIRINNQSYKISL